MSWSIDAEVLRPVEVSALLSRTREVLRELLALDELPELISDVPMVTIEPKDTDLSFQVLLPTGDGAEVMTVWLPEYMDEWDTMLVSVETRYLVGTSYVSVVLCIALALAVAELGGGRFLDEQRGIVRPEMDDPAEVIATTRLAPSELGFADRCLSYVLQFGHDHGWAKSVAE